MDWRIDNQKNYLLKAVLNYSEFSPSMQCDHAHCAFCWEKFGQGENMLHYGYRTLDQMHWICEQCFNDFREVFDWVVKFD